MQHVLRWLYSLWEHVCLLITSQRWYNGRVYRTYKTKQNRRAVILAFSLPASSPWIPKHVMFQRKNSQHWDRTPLKYRRSTFLASRSSVHIEGMLHRSTAHPPMQFCARWSTRREFSVLSICRHWKFWYRTKAVYRRTLWLRIPSKSVSNSNIEISTTLQFVFKSTSSNRSRRDLSN